MIPYGWFEIKNPSYPSLEAFNIWILQNYCLQIPTKSASKFCCTKLIYFWPRAFDHVVLGMFHHKWQKLMMVRKVMPKVSKQSLWGCSKKMSDIFFLFSDTPLPHIGSFYPINQYFLINIWPLLSADIFYLFNIGRCIVNSICLMASKLESQCTLQILNK